MQAATTNRLIEYIFDDAIRGDPTSVTRAFDGYARRAPDMMHLGADKGELFDRAVAQTGARRVLELGTNYGYSALRLAKILGSPTFLGRPIEIHSVEVDPTLVATATAIISFAGLSGKIEVHEGEAQDVLDRFDVPFDLVFIDHMPHNYLPDLKKIEALGLLRKDGTLISDNVVLFKSELAPYLAHLRQSGMYHSTLHQPHPGADGIEVSVRCR